MSPIATFVLLFKGFLITKAFFILFIRSQNFNWKLFFWPQLAISWNSGKNTSLITKSINLATGWLKASFNLPIRSSFKLNHSLYELFRWMHGYRKITYDFSYKMLRNLKKEKTPFSIFQELQHELRCYRLKRWWWWGECVRGEDIYPEKLERKIEKWSLFPD